MDFQKAILYSPERLVWTSVCVLGPVMLLVAGWAFPWSLDAVGTSALFSDRFLDIKAPKPLEFQLARSGSDFAIPIPDIAHEMEVLLNPPRPGKEGQKPQLYLRLKKSGQVREVAFPLRLDLEYRERDQLVFSEMASPFWIELQTETDKEVRGQTCLQTAPQAGHNQVPFSLPIQPPTPLQGVEGFPEGSPFRHLAEAKWLGADLVRARYGALQRGVQRLEWGNPEEERLELNGGGWAVWKGGQWESSQQMEAELPIARVQSAGERQLVLEGWEGDRYFCIGLPPSPPTPPKGRVEDLFSSVRIRSDKQMSCMLEKQCLILKTGDWVVKVKGRWKILRKKEDRDAFLNGKWVGELFVFEGIETKQGQKVIQGRLFHPNRSQMVPVELSVQSRKPLTAGRAK